MAKRDSGAKRAKKDGPKTIADVLSTVREIGKDEDLAVYVSNAAAEATSYDRHGRAALVSANASRYRIGQAWARAMPKKRADREAWMREQGAPLDLKLTRVRQIIRVARAVDKAIEAISTDGLPISVLDRRLESVPTAIRAVLDGRDPDAPALPKPKPTADEQLTSLQRRSERLMEDVQKLPEQYRVDALLHLVTAAASAAEALPAAQTKNFGTKARTRLKGVGTPTRAALKVAGEADEPDLVSELFGDEGEGEPAED